MICIYSQHNFQNMLIYILRNDSAICFEDKEETIPITLILIMETHSDFPFVVEVDLNL